MSDDLIARLDSAMRTLPWHDDRMLLRDAIVALRKAEAERDALARGVRISIPTETMEQEFATHYRRGYEKGKADVAARLARAEELLRGMRAPESQYTRLWQWNHRIDVFLCEREGAGR